MRNMRNMQGFWLERETANLIWDCTYVSQALAQRIAQHIIRRIYLIWKPCVIRSDISHSDWFICHETVDTLSRKTIGPEIALTGDSLTSLYHASDTSQPRHSQGRLSQPRYLLGETLSPERWRFKNTRGWERDGGLYPISINFSHLENFSQTRFFKFFPNNPPLISKFRDFEDILRTPPRSNYNIRTAPHPNPKSKSRTAESTSREKFRENST